MQISVPRVALGLGSQRKRNLPGTGWDENPPRQRGCGDHSCLVANCPCGVEELSICEGLRTAFLQG